MSIEKEKLVVSLKNDGKSYGDIENFMNITRNSTISLCRYQYKKFQNKRGPKSKITKSQKLLIKRTVSSIRDKQEKANSVKLKNECEINISIRTI